MKRKTNISVQNNLGTRVSSNMIVGGKYNGYQSGDILDANATVDKIESIHGHVPTKVSELENDMNYTTQEEVGSAVNNAVEGVVGDASEDMNTLGKIESVVNDIQEEIDSTKPSLISTIHIIESNDGYHKALITGDIAVVRASTYYELKDVEQYPQEETNYRFTFDWFVDNVDDMIFYVANQSNGWNLILYSEVLLDAISIDPQYFSDVDGKIEYTDAGEYLMTSLYSYKFSSDTINYIENTFNSIAHGNEWKNGRISMFFMQSFGALVIEDNIDHDTTDIVYCGDDSVCMKSPNKNVISWIRANSMNVWGIWDSNLKALKVLLKTDDNVDAEWYSYDDHDGLSDYGSFMKLPQFWYKCVNTLQGCDILFTKDDPNDNSWIEWDGNTFIRTYKQFDVSVENWGMPIDSYYTVNRSYRALKDDIHDAYIDLECIDKISMIKYDTHKIMEILFYAFYGEVDAQLICGIGHDADYASPQSDYNWPLYDIFVPFNIAKDSIGEANGGDPLNTVFWGLSDWYGNISEYIDDVKMLGYYDDEWDMKHIRIGVLNYNNNIVRTIDTSFHDAMPLKKIWGKYADVITKPGFSGDTYTSDYQDLNDGGYTVICSVDSNPNEIAIRSGEGSDYGNGVGCLNFYYSTDGENDYTGARFQYHGPWVEVDKSQFQHP